MKEGVTLGPLPVSGPHRSPTSSHFGKKEVDEGRKEGGEKRWLKGFFPPQASSRTGVWGKMRAYTKALAPLTRPKVHLHRF